MGQKGACTLLHERGKKQTTSIASHELGQTERVSHHEVPEGPERVERGAVLAVVGQPVGGQLGLVCAGVGLAGVELLLPVGHGLAVRGEALDVPGKEKESSVSRDSVRFLLSFHT